MHDIYGTLSKNQEEQVSCYGACIKLAVSHLRCETGDYGWVVYAVRFKRNKLVQTSSLLSLGKGMA